MALSDGAASAIDAFRLNKRIASHYAEQERKAAAEAERLSSNMSYTDELGNVWTYAYVDDETTTIQKGDVCVSTLAIPGELGGKPVTAIAPEALSKQEIIEELTIPDTVTSIGGGAFRSCLNLKKVTFPRDLSDFNSGWLHYCDKIVEMTLPGAWDDIRANVFDLPMLRTLHIGHGTLKVESGAFQKSKLETVTVADDNEVLASDGRALYSKDGKTLVVLAVPSDSYTVADGCENIARKAFSCFPDLVHITLPDSIADIGEFAYSRTGIERFVAPRGLKVIREKAFFRCIDLAEVELNDGLEEIAQEAFATTAITHLQLPRTMKVLGKRIGNDTALTYSGPEATLTIVDDAQYLSLDEQGVLYSTLGGEKALARIVDPDATDIVVEDGTKSVLEGAATHHMNLASIVLPEGMEVIGREAFKGCRNLSTVKIPDTVYRIEDEAFLDTVLTSFHLPASLTYFGDKAIVTYGAHHVDAMKPSLREVDVPDELKDRFFVTSGLLCQRRADNKVRVVVCLGAEKIVVPPDTLSIDDYAFSNQRGIRDLTFSDGIRSIGMCGFALCCYVEHIHINCIKPIEGHESFDLYFPFNDRAIQQTKLVFGMMRSVSIQRIFGAYDQCIANGAGLQGGQSDSGMTLYDQAGRMIERLADPIFLSRVHKSMFLSFLKHGIEDICFEIARKDDRRAFDKLLEFGFINDENLLRVIDRVQTVQDASMTGYLLEVRRRVFHQDILDFEL